MVVLFSWADMELTVFKRAKVSGYDQILDRMFLQSRELSAMRNLLYEHALEYTEELSMNMVPSKIILLRFA
jgi:hypothetical protein